MEKQLDAVEGYSARKAQAAAELGKVAGHETIEGQEFPYIVLSDPLLRMRYVQLTSELVDRAVAENIQTMVFLDKSARPVYWLMRELWPLLAANHDVNADKVEIPPMPDIKFVNIDRGVWIKKTGGVEDDEGGRVEVSPQTVGREINNLRAAFIKDPKAVTDRVDEFGHETFLDGQNIMIVDEVKVSGNTLEIADQFFKKAFPTSNIISEHWMHPQIKSDKRGNRFNADLPIWYSDVNALGRGIGDLSPAASQQSKHVRIRRGSKFFSRPLDGQDDLSIQLRSEIRQLPREIISGRLPLRLNTEGIDSETIDKRLAFMEVVNHGVSARELTQMVSRCQTKPEKLLELYEAAKKF
jgi:hypothetical protein